MNLPENLATSIRSRLKSEADLTDSGLDEILQGLESNTPISWNLLLNKELTTTEDHETDD